jgi:Fur family ferric uptake transcriptional regulator
MSAVSISKSCKKILTVLKEDQLHSAQEIHALMRNMHPRAPGLSTVYRSLELLVNAGLLQAVDLGDGERRYELVKPGEHHHHLFCESCGISIHLDECIIAKFEDTIRDDYGFRVKGHVLEIFGRCKNCLGESQR